jgi:hypothetical protein
LKTNIGEREIRVTTNTALIEKREELKRRLAAGEYKTLIDIFLDRVDHLIRKITRQSRTLPTWIITIILSLGFTLIGFAIIYISGDKALLNVLTTASGGLGSLTVLLGSVIAILIAVVMNEYIRRIFELWRDEVLDATESMASLDDFENWLRMSCNWRLHLLATIIAVMILTPNAIFLLKTQLDVSIAYGSILSLFLISMFAYAFFYLFLMVILLSARLRRYDLKLFATDPSNSELIARLSSELGWVIYVVAFYAIIGLISIRLVFGSIDPFVVVVQLLLAWLPMIALFILIQTSLSTMIRSVKWKTLNEVQAKIEKLRTSKNFGSPKTIDTINKLMDYHDRVKATRDSALDFRTYLSFINSLLLPLLAFVLGNLDLVLKLFGKKP